MKRIVFIERDEDNGIALCRDHYHGIVVQVIRFVDQLQPSGLDKVMTNFRVQQVIESISVPIVSNNNVPFQDRVKQAIAKCREVLSYIKKQDQDIEGVLNSYWSANKEING